MARELSRIEPPPFQTDLPKHKERTERSPHAPILAPALRSVDAIAFDCYGVCVEMTGEELSASHEHIELLHTQKEEKRKARLALLQESLEKSKSSQSWGVAMKFFGWLAAVLMFAAGAGMAVAGLGLPAGLLFAGGALMVTNLLMEETGGWEKLLPLLPGKTDAERRTVLFWLQIGIAGASAILSAAGMFVGGLSSLGEMMRLLLTTFGGVAMTGQGIVSIGIGVTQYRFKNALADLKESDTEMVMLRHEEKERHGYLAELVDQLKDLHVQAMKLLQRRGEDFRLIQRSGG